MMSQTMPSSYRELFARLKECDDPIERALLTRLLDEYNRNHDNDFAEVERFVSEAVAAACPRCGSRQAKKMGKAPSGAQRLMCKRCGRTFNAASRTPLFGTKVNMAAWMSFLECLISGSSVKTACVAAKVSLPTGSRWMGKIFDAVEHYQDSTVLSGKVWIDETYVDVNSSERAESDEIGKVRKVRMKLRGISRNKICVLAATDGGRCFAFVCGTGRPRKAKNLEICSAHVSRGSTIVGDIDTSMQLAADTLGLKRVMYKSSTYEAYENLAPIDGVCDRFKLFVRKHRGFDKHNLQRWCNLFAFMENEKHFDPDIFSVSKRLLIMIISTGKTRK